MAKHCDKCGAELGRIEVMSAEAIVQKHGGNPPYICNSCLHPGGASNGEEKKDT